MDDTYLSTELALMSAAGFLNIGRKRLIRWWKEGQISGQKRDGDYYFSRKALLEFARQYCLECGLDHWEIEEDLFFCPHCASAFAPYDTNQELQLFGSMEEQRIKLFLMRIQADIESDKDAAKRLQERLSVSALRSYQIWFEHQYQKRGTLRLGIRDIPDEDLD